MVLTARTGPWKTSMRFRFSDRCGSARRDGQIIAPPAPADRSCPHATPVRTPSAIGFGARGTPPRRHRSASPPDLADARGHDRHVRPSEAHRSGTPLGSLDADRRIAAHDAGRVRERTIMFTDIAGFTQLAETLPPTLVGASAAQPFPGARPLHRGRARPHRQDHGRRADGRLGKRRGPRPTGPRPASGPRDPARGRTDNGHRLRRGQPAIRLRVGLHAGPLIATPSGRGRAPRHRPVRRHGECRPAARGCRARRLPGRAVTIVASDAVVVRAGRGFRFDELGELAVRGRREPVLAFQVAGLARERSRCVRTAPV